MLARRITDAGGAHAREYVNGILCLDVALPRRQMAVIPVAFDLKQADGGVQNES